MCGLVGFWQATALQRDKAEKTIATMTTALAHRGPDDSGYLLEASDGLALGHRRLSIIDLSSAGHQPMVSSSGRTVIVYNGEVYNYTSLRRELRDLGIKFRSQTDTEVILEGCEHWGVRKTLQRLNGMFAFALWDRRRRTLTLARDRLGIKPLYYGRLGNVLFFTSELKALRRHPTFKAEVDRNSLTLFFRYGYIPAPRTIFHDVFKLQSGHWLTLKSPGGNPSPERYWSLPDVIKSGSVERARVSIAEAEDELNSLLRDAVRCRMIADVPLGAFLSGGIDSSLVVSLMQAQSDRPVQTFSIGFQDEEYNEAMHARAVADHLGTEHVEIYVTAKEARETIPALPTIFDEPFSDSSQIPTFLVSRLARQHVAVSLSGDGGDELFGGYTRYRLSRDLWRLIGWLPPWVRRFASQGIRTVPLEAWNLASTGLQPIVRRYVRSGDVGDKLYKLSEVLEAPDSLAAYNSLQSKWKSPATLVKMSTEPGTPLSDARSVAWLSDFTRQMMYLDLLTYLPDDILTKVDRASMAVGLEARVPLLDHRVVEFAWGLPLNLILRHGSGKWITKKVLYRYLPTRFFERPKKGFAIPIGKWLRGPLREWAEELLAEDRLRREGYLESKHVSRKWHEHTTLRRDWGHLLWDILIFQTWREQWH